jgi:hypothetical protein
MDRASRHSGPSAENIRRLKTMVFDSTSVTHRSSVIRITCIHDATRTPSPSIDGLDVLCNY